MLSIVFDHSPIGDRLQYIIKRMAVLNHLLLRVLGDSNVV